MLEQVENLIEEYAMLPPGGTVLCAVSGGADSVCLLHLLRERAGRGEFSLAAAHYDHRLRGEDSTADAQFVENLCKMWTIPLCLGSGDVAGEARRRGKGVEETARAMRYAFLEEAAAQAGADVIVTAHNADDNAETPAPPPGAGDGTPGSGRDSAPAGEGGAAAAHRNPGRNSGLSGEKRPHLAGGRQQCR